MTVSEEDAHNEAPLLEIELMEISHGCLARLSGDLVAETMELSSGDGRLRPSKPGFR